MNDHSHPDHALYAGRRWVAETLGMSVSTFDHKRKSLEEQGFPKRDALIGMYLKADVLAWASRRRQVANTIEASPPNEEGPQINEDEL
jgi:hypothetical protein